MSSYYEKFLATGEVKCIDEEIPFEIPKGWEWCRLKHMCSMQAGKNISASEIYDEKSVLHPYRCVGGNGLRGFTNTFNAEGHFAIIGRQGALCGCLNIESGKFYATEHAVVVNGFGIIPSLFIYYFFTALNLNQYATATAQPGLAVSNIVEVFIPLPPLPEQLCIVSKIEKLLPLVKTYEQAQNGLNELNASLNEQLRKSILQEAIQGKLVPQIAEEGTAEKLLTEIREEKERLIKEGKLKKSALADSIIYKGDDNKYWEKKENNVVCIDDEIPFVIPNSWNWCRLKDIGRTETGTTPSKSHPEYFGNYIPFLSPANILGSKIISETQGLSNIGIEFGRVVPKNSILQVCIGGSIGKCAIVNKPATFNQQINSITPYLCNVEFVHIVLQSEYFRLAIMDKATGTATPIINRGNWETLLFPLPPLKEQLRIIEKYKGVTSIMS